MATKRRQTILKWKAN